MDHSKKHYYEVTGTSPFGWKVYHYDTSGNIEVNVSECSCYYDSEENAADAACKWLEESGMDAEYV